MNKIKLGSVLRIMHGYAFKSENYVTKSQYRLITLGNFEEGNNSFKYNNAKATYYGAEFPKEFIISSGDLILPLTEQVVGLFGNSAFVPEVSEYTFVLNQRVGKVICDETKVDKLYLHYLLATKSVKDQLEARASGTQQRNISPDDVYDIEVFLPSLHIQKQIGNLLYNIEQKQGENNTIQLTLESMAKLLYDYWFVQFDFPDENGKPYKSSGGKMVWNEELKREIPEGWEVKHASDLTSVKTGKEDANFATPYGKYAYFTCGQDILKCDSCAFEGRAVLLAGNGDFNVKHYTGKFNAYQRTYVLIPNNKKYYALLYIATKKAVARFTRGSAGSIVKFITLGDVNGITLLDPQNDSMLEEFNLILDKIEQIQEENQQLDSLRDFLLPMLMNGQVKVGNSK